jgi:hypothetical protein
MHTWKSCRFDQPLALFSPICSEMSAVEKAEKEITDSASEVIVAPISDYQPAFRPQHSAYFRQADLRAPPIMECVARDHCIETVGTERQCLRPACSECCPGKRPPKSHPEHFNAQVYSDENPFKRLYPVVRLDLRNREQFDKENRHQRGRRSSRQCPNAR